MSEPEPYPESLARDLTATLTDAGLPPSEHGDIRGAVLLLVGLWRGERQRADEAEAALHATQGEVDRRRPCGNCQHRASIHGRGYSGCLRCDCGAFIAPATAVD